MTARVTERDVRILAKFAVARWLTTDQIHSAYFPKQRLMPCKSGCEDFQTQASSGPTGNTPPPRPSMRSVPRAKLWLRRKALRLSSEERFPGSLNTFWGSMRYA